VVLLIPIKRIDGVAGGVESAFFKVSLVGVNELKTACTGNTWEEKCEVGNVLLYL